MALREAAGAEDGWTVGTVVWLPLSAPIEFEWLRAAEVRPEVLLFLRRIVSIELRSEEESVRYSISSLEGTSPSAPAGGWAVGRIAGATIVSVSEVHTSRAQPAPDAGDEARFFWHSMAVDVVSWSVYSNSPHSSPHRWLPFGAGCCVRFEPFDCPAQAHQSTRKLHSRPRYYYHYHYYYYHYYEDYYYYCHYYYYYYYLYYHYYLCYYYYYYY